MLYCEVPAWGTALMPLSVTPYGLLIIRGKWGDEPTLCYLKVPKSDHRWEANWGVLRVSKDATKSGNGQHGKKKPIFT